MKSDDGKVLENVSKVSKAAVKKQRVILIVHYFEMKFHKNSNLKLFHKIVEFAGSHQPL
jgi:hypothetical protein